MHILHPLGETSPSPLFPSIIRLTSWEFKDTFLTPRQRAGDSQSPETLARAPGKSGQLRTEISLTVALSLLS